MSGRWLCHGHFLLLLSASWAFLITISGHIWGAAGILSLNWLVHSQGVTKISIFSSWTRNVDDYDYTGGVFFFFFFFFLTIRYQQHSIDAPQKPRESGLIIFYGLFMSISWSVYFTIQHSPYAFAQQKK